jgi:cell division transport system ATP-binding protein
MIEFRNVRKVYNNGTTALDGVNLKVNDGEFIFVVGASGAGKSTLIKLLLREERVTSGRLTVDEFDLVKLPNFKVPFYRRQIGVVFQDFRLFPNKTVYENVAFAMRVIGEPTSVIRRRVPTILSIVNLQDKYKNFPSQLSGGEQQRVAFARAMANNPRTIIADEPTGNIDPQLSLEIMSLLIKIHKKNKTVIVVTHEKSLVDYFQQRVVTLKDGKITDDRVGGMYNAQV